MKTCINCGFAKWNRTSSLRLHPDGGGMCTWEVPEFPIPKSMYWLGYPKPVGGYIDRKQPLLYENCPAWKSLE